MANRIIAGLAAGADWMADVVPHMAYAVVTALTFEAIKEMSRAFARLISLTFALPYGTRGAGSSGCSGGGTCSAGGF